MHRPVIAGCGAITRIGKRTRIGRLTRVAVRPVAGSDRVWLTVQHASTAVTLLLLPQDVDTLCDALAAAAPTPYLPVGQP